MAGVELLLVDLERPTEGSLGLGEPSLLVEEPAEVGEGQGGERVVGADDKRG